MSNMRRTGRYVVATIGAATLATVLAVPAAADGGQVPSQAVPVSLGVAYFGDNSDYSCNIDTCRIDFWKLPALLAQDVVTVAWKQTGRNGPFMCLQGGVDDYSWNDNLCNLSSGVYSNTAGQRSTLTASKATDPAFLTFRDKDCFGPCGYYGPYQFTVESIQHALGLSLSKPNGKTVKGTAYLSNGQPAPDGLVVPLLVRVGGKTVAAATATTSGGRLTYQLSVPKAWRGKTATIRLARPGDAGYLDASTAPVKLRLP